MLLVTHYERLLELIVPDRVHVLAGGRIVKSGGTELARELDERGYDWIQGGGTRVNARHHPTDRGRHGPGAGAHARGASRRARGARRGRLADAAAGALALHGPRAARDRRLRARPSAASEASARRAYERLLGDPAFGDASRQLVLLDGRRVAGLGAADDRGLEITRPRRALERLRAAVRAADLGGTASARRAEHGVRRHGVWLSVPAGIAVERADSPRVRRLAVAGSRAQPRIVLEVEAGAQATFVQHFIDCDSDPQGWTNSVTQLKQAAGSRLALYRMQRHSGGARAHVAADRGACGRRGADRRATSTSARASSATTSP